MCKASQMSDCDFDRMDGQWVCTGRGNLIGELSYGRGSTREAAYADYLRVRRAELADMIEEDADEAELVQQDDGAGARGSSIRDIMLATADVEAMRQRAARLRRESQ